MQAPSRVLPLLALLAVPSVSACDPDDSDQSLRAYQEQPLEREEGDPSAGGGGGGGGGGSNANEGAEVFDCGADYEDCWPGAIVDWLNAWEPDGEAQVHGLDLFRVRHCLDEDNVYECMRDNNSQLSHSMFEPWESNNVPRDKQNDTYIAVGGPTDPSQVRHIVFMAAGQQAGSGDHAQYPCGQTGQHIGYKQPFLDDHSLGQDGFALDPASLIYQVLNTNVPGTAAPMRDLSDTFVGLALDHRLNYNLGNDNERVVDAYFEWLSARAVDGNLESIIFAGHSRGGNLVTKLAQRFAHEGSDVKIVVQLYEAVSELHELYDDPSTGNQSGRFTERVDNPRSPSGNNWQGRRVDWQYAFNRPNTPTDVRVLNLTGGQCTLFQPVCVRPISGTPPNSSSLAWTMVRNGERFYDQCWTTTDHGQTSHVFVGDDPNAGTDGARGIRHLFASCAEMRCL